MGREFRPGALRPWELVGGLEGICGDEKLLPPRLPEEPPPPAFAQALDSMNVAIPKKNIVESARAKCNLVFICRFLLSVVLDLGNGFLFFSNLASVQQECQLAKFRECRFGSLYEVVQTRGTSAG